jgi:hypothetical protein
MNSRKKYRHLSSHHPRKVFRPYDRREKTQDKNRLTNFFGQKNYSPALIGRWIPQGEEHIETY